MSLSLDWNGDLKFTSGADGPPMRFDGGDNSVTGPVQALAYAAMGCMAMDVVHILQKGRHDLKALRIVFDGDRAAEHPKRYTAIRMRFEVTGAVPEDAITRAIDLSKSKYCSVFNSLRQDIDVQTSVSVTA